MAQDRRPHHDALVGALDASIAWVANNLHYFDPFHRKSAFDLRYTKRIVELAMMLSRCVTITNQRQPNTVQAVADIKAFLRDIADRPSFGDLTLRVPSRLILFSDVYGSMSRYGHDDRSLRNAIELAVMNGFSGYGQRIPHRIMDLRLSLESANVDIHLPTMQELAQLAASEFALSPLHLDEGGVYSLTHLVMFFYRYGDDRRADIYSDMESLQSLWKALIVIWAQRSHWDLLAEVLFCWDCVGWESTGLTERYWQVLLDQQQADGAFPELGFDRLAGRPQENTSDQSRHLRYFESHYHTTLVGVMAMGLHRDRCGGPGM
jgi:hypothetical protein